MEDMAPKEIAKHLEALAVRLEGSEQITSGVGGSLIVGVGTPQMRLESGGAIALTDCALHFYRTSWRGGTHETVPTSRITGAEPLDLVADRAACGVVARPGQLEGQLVAAAVARHMKDAGRPRGLRREQHPVEPLDLHHPGAAAGVGPGHPPAHTLQGQPSATELAARGGMHEHGVAGRCLRSRWYCSQQPGGRHRDESRGRAGPPAASP